MKFTKREGIIALISIMILFGIIWLVIPFGSFRRNDILVLSTFIFNGLLWTVLLFYEIIKHAFSLAFMHWSFCLLFFFFAPMVQYAYNIFPWVYYRSDEILLVSNIILLIWTLFVFLGGCIKSKKFNDKKIQEKVDFHNAAKYCLAVLTVITLWRLVNIGFINLLARSTNVYAVSDSSAITLLIGHSLSAIAYFSTMFCILACKNNNQSTTYAVIAGILILFAYPPSGLARYQAAVIYLGLLLTCSKYLKKGRMFSVIFLLGFLIFLPFLNAFRNTAIDDVSYLTVIENIISNLSITWLAWDYDAYTMLTLAIDYIEENGISWGIQYLGVVFFWIPRELWPTKPVGSGAEIANSLGLFYNNLSCPLPAEGMINFSIIGMAIFAFLVGYIMKCLDNLYWKNPLPNRSLCILYPMGTVFFFFMSRGDLMSSTSYLISFLVIGIFYIKAITILNTINVK